MPTRLIYFTKRISLHYKYEFIDFYKETSLNLFFFII